MVIRKFTKWSSFVYTSVRKPLGGMRLPRYLLASFCRETLEMGVFQGVRAYAEALEWLSWLRSGTDQRGHQLRLDWTVCDFGRKPTSGLCTPQRFVSQRMLKRNDLTGSHRPESRSWR